MQERSLRFAEVMAPSFVEGLRVVHGQLDPESNLGEVTGDCLSLVDAQLEDVDWQSEGLGDVWINGANILVPPDEFSHYLCEIAFRDALLILDYVKSNSEDLALQSGVSYGAMVQRSKQPLLSVSQLMDTDKEKLFAALEQTDIAGCSIGIDIDAPAIVIGQGQDGLTRFQWNDKITLWIEDNLVPERGCPANHVTIETPEGRKQTLMFHFWDKLVEANYPV